MDYKKELENLEEAKNWFKPRAGKYKIVFLNNGEETISHWEGEDIPKVRFLIEVNKIQYTWDVTKGKTKNSLWGQLVLVGANREHGLLGTLITLLVKGEGKTTDYTVEEALPLMYKEEIVVDE